MDGCARLGLGEVILVKVDAAVGEFAEGSLLLELCHKNTVRY